MGAWWTKKVDDMTLFVDDLQQSKLFYQDVFGLSVVYEDEDCAVFNLGSMSLNLLHISAAHELIEPAVVASRNTGSRFQFTIQVDDVDDVCVELGTRGVTLLNGPINRPWGRRTASFMDPSGHIWEIAQILS